MNRIKLNIKDCFIFSLVEYKTKFKQILTACLILYLISWLTQYGTLKWVGLIILPITGGGFCIYCLKLFREESVTIKDLWMGFSKIIPVFLIFITPAVITAVPLIIMRTGITWFKEYSDIFTVVGFLLLVALWFIWLTKCPFALLAVLDKRLSIISACHICR